MKEEKKQKAICYLKIDKKNAPIFKYIKELEKYCHEKYNVIDWYIDIVDNKRVINPSLIRMMEDITTRHNICDIIVTINRGQLCITEEGLKVCQDIFKNVGVEWIVLEHSHSLWSSSIIDVGVKSFELRESHLNINRIEAEIDKIKDELYMR